MSGESNSYTAAASTSSSAFQEGQKSLLSTGNISYKNLYLHSYNQYLTCWIASQNILTYIFQFSYVCCMFPYVFLTVRLYLHFLDSPADPKEGKLESYKIYDSKSKTRKKNRKVTPHMKQMKIKMIL